MAFTRANRVARSSSALTAINQAVTPLAGDSVLVVLLNVIGSADRAGGALIFAGTPMIQADITRKAAASPEASAELWYTFQVPIGPQVLQIPNAGAATVKYTVEVGRTSGGARAALDAATGAAATGTNPSPGAVTITQLGGVAWAVVASGAQTWAPSAQVGTAIANTDDGATGGGEQYRLNSAVGSLTLSWTFGTSEDYGAVVAAFKEVPPPRFNNLLFVDVGDGMSCTEKSR